MVTAYAVDTQVFNWVLDFGFDLSKFQPAQFFISPIQAAELQASKDTERNSALLNLLKVWDVQTRPAESLVFGRKGLGFGNWKWSDGKTYEAILDALNAAKPKSNNIEDALIGEQALKNDWVLLTGDRTLAETTKGLGAQVHFVEHPSKAKLGEANV